MPAHDLDNVGDEPIYCDTQHDEILYSGSEDDYYEAPDHRRLRIEAKAIHFLNGNLPYLLSARLKGPFDAKSWNNPWKSKRAQRQAAQRKSQSRRSTTTVEPVRGHGSSKATDDLPDTQRTSLYPLPSPETTNPPSATNNPFMADEEFNRIKTWRKTVKSVPMSTDPFWASQQDESQRSTGTGKRSANQDWLRKPESKKRKSEDLRKLVPEESPSQTAAKMRRNPLPGHFAEIVTQSAPGSPTYENELAAYWGPSTASVDTSRMANIPTHTPGDMQTARTPQPSSKHSLVHERESSEDELSIQSIARSRHASRSPLKRTLGSTTDDTPSRRNKGDSSEFSRTRGYVGTATLHLVNDNPASHRSSLGKTDRIWSRRKRTAASVSASQNAQDMGEATSAASPLYIPRSQASAQEKSSRLVKSALRRVVGASQQDNSFHFHQAASKSHSTIRNVPPKVQMDGTTLSLPSSQPSIPATATEHLDREDGQSCVEKLSVCAPAPSDEHMNVDPSEHQQAPPELPPVASMSDEEAKMADAGNHETRAIQPQVIDALPVAGSRQEKEPGDLGQPPHKRLPTHTSAEPNLSTHACTQELSPVSMQGKAQNYVASIAVIESLHLTVDDVDVSNPEWSTYIDTQDLSPPSKRSSSFVEAAKDAEKCSQVADDLNDSEWTTYANTQDVTGTTTENDTVSKDEDGLLVVDQGFDDTCDPEWSTVVSDQHQPNVETQCDEVPVTVGRRGLDPEPSDHKATVSAADDMESTSESLSSLSASSQGGADQTVNTSNELVLAKAPALDPRSSPGTFGSIIDAYAGRDDSHDEFEDCPESQLPIGDQQDTDTGIQCQDGREAHETEGARPETTTVATKEEVPAPGARMERADRPMEEAENSAFNFDDTTVSYESPILLVEKTPLQSPWAKDGTDLPMPTITSNDTTLNESTSKLSVLAGQALAFSPAPQTPWGGDRLPSPDFSLSVKRFSDFMRPSPSKKHASADGSILRGLGGTSRALMEMPIPAKTKRRVTFAPLPGEEVVLAVPESKDNGIYVEEDLSYFDAKGKKTASIRVTRSQTRAASPPPSGVNDTDADDLPDYDHKFARHFEAMSKRQKDPPRKTQRLLPSDSQQTNGSQAIDAMAEAFIQASQTRKRSSELVEAVDDNSRLAHSSLEKMSSHMVVDSIEHQENIDPVDDVSAVLDNIDDFLDNCWGFDTSLNVDKQEVIPKIQQAQTAPSPSANVAGSMLDMHTNVWAD